jgi:hypothetical protein
MFFIGLMVGWVLTVCHYDGVELLKKEEEAKRASKD